MSSSPGCCTTPARATPASGRGSRTRSARAYGAWIWPSCRRLPGFRAALERLRTHAERSARAGRGRRLPVRTVELIRYQDAPRRPRVRRAAPARRRGQLSVVDVGVPVIGRQRPCPVRRRSTARDGHAGPGGRIRRAAGAAAVADRGAPARRHDHPAGCPGRRLPRRARAPSKWIGWATSARSWRSPAS